MPQIPCTYSTGVPPDLFLKDHDKNYSGLITVNRVMADSLLSKIKWEGVRSPISCGKSSDD